MNKILKVMCFILFALFAGINTIYAQGQSPTGLVVDENGQAIYFFSLMWVTNSKKSLIKEKRY